MKGAEINVHQGVVTLDHQLEALQPSDELDNAHTQAQIPSSKSLLSDFSEDTASLPRLLFDMVADIQDMPEIPIDSPEEHSDSASRDSSTNVYQLRSTSPARQPPHSRRPNVSSRDAMDDLKRRWKAKHHECLEANKTGDASIADPAEEELDELEGMAKALDKKGFIA